MFDAQAEPGLGSISHTTWELELCFWLCLKYGLMGGV